MTSWNKLAPYMQRYTIRVLLFMVSYMLILTSSLAFARGGTEHSQATLIGLALISALPIIGVFWAIFRLLVEINDEYQRLLFAKQTLLATAFTRSRASEPSSAVVSSRQSPAWPPRRT